jgi:hypothetical protein
MKATSTTKEQINSYLDRLSLQDQERVLAFVQRLAGVPQGIPAQEFLDFFRQFPLTQEEADNMRQILDEIEQ